MPGLGTHEEDARWWHLLASARLLAEHQPEEAALQTQHESVGRALPGLKIGQKRPRWRIQSAGYAPYVAPRRQDERIAAGLAPARQPESLSFGKFCFAHG